MLKKRMKIRKNPKCDFWYDLPDNIKLQIDTAITQLEEGKGVLHEDVMAEAKERFLKKQQF